jgi:hypothetical protein
MGVSVAAAIHASPISCSIEHSLPCELSALEEDDRKKKRIGERAERSMRVRVDKGKCRTPRDGRVVATDRGHDHPLERYFRLGHSLHES